MFDTQKKYLKELGHVEEDGEADDEEEVEVELPPGEVVAVDKVGDEADADVALPGEDDGAVDGAHEGDVDQRQEDGHHVRVDEARVVRPELWEGVEQRAGDDDLGQRKALDFTGQLRY